MKLSLDMLFCRNGENVVVRLENQVNWRKDCLDISYKLLRKRRDYLGCYTWNQGKMLKWRNAFNILWDCKIFLKLKGKFLLDD